MSKGHELFQKLLSFTRPVEAFATLNGNFVMLFNGDSSDLRKIQKKLSKKDVLDSVVIEKINDPVIKGFYNLLKNSPKEAIVTIETKTVSQMLQMAQEATISDLELIELRSARSLVGLNFLMVTGTVPAIKKFSARLKKNKKIKCSDVIEPDSSFRSFFNFP